jgi:DNA polymerase III delta prime subunit
VPSDLSTAHAHAREYFRRALRRGRLAHAYLFVGPPEAEKERFALDLAKTLFCARSAGGLSCEACASCRAIAHGNHAGVEVFGPQEGRQVVDIDTVRALCERSHYRRDHVFVAVLAAADALTPPAANALLKTLEEPPSDFLLLLTATSSGGLLPTIVSRCHRVFFTTASGAGSGGGGEEGEDRAAEVLRERLADRRSFYAQIDLRRFPEELVPEAESARERVRRLIAAAVRDNRRALAGAAARPRELDALIGEQRLLLGLERALAGNVQADLVFEMLASRLASRRVARS